jgi:hypothetical protein
MTFRTIPHVRYGRVSNPPTTAQVRDALFQRARELGWPVVRRVGGSEVAWWNFVYGDPLKGRRWMGCRGRNALRLLADCDGLSGESEITVTKLQVDVSRERGRDGGAKRERRNWTVAPLTRTTLKRSAAHV